MAITNSERITTRMNLETKELLERALVLSGHASLNSFITAAATMAAKKLIEQEMTISLTHQEALNFLDALDKPRTANPRFLAAAKRYKETLNNDDTSIK